MDWQPTGCSHWPLWTGKVSHGVFSWDTLVNKIWPKCPYWECRVAHHFIKKLNKINGKVSHAGKIRS